MCSTNHKSKMNRILLLLLIIAALQGVSNRSIKRLKKGTGRSNHHHHRIYNGQIAHKGEFPFIVSLDWNGDHFCGGSAVSDYWVVTAAHCVDNPYILNQTRVRSGSLTSGTGGTLHNIATNKIHAGYNMEHLKDDIALLKVDEPFTASSGVGYVRLQPPEDYVSPGEFVIAAGWGMTSDYSDVSEELRKVTLSVERNENCNEVPEMQDARMYHPYLEVTENMMCSDVETTGVCRGDSGGPLLTIEDKEYALVGISSWGPNSGACKNPGVFTRVAPYRKWIYLNSATLPQ